MRLGGRVDGLLWGLHGGFWVVRRGLMVAWLDWFAGVKVI